ncbi:MAG: hypothetical protein ACK5IQ_06095 [Bacteroidales bacterium]
MFKISSKIEFVSLPYIQQGIVSYKKDDKLFINNSVVDVNPMLWEFDSNKNKIWLRDYDWNSYLIDVRTLNVDKVPVDIALGCVYKEYGVGFYSNRLALYNMNNYQFQTYIESNFNSFKHCVFTDSLFVLGKECGFHAYSLPSATPLWTFDASSLGAYIDIDGKERQYEVDSFLGVYNNCLLVACSGRLIIELDMETGVQIRSWQHLEGFGDAKAFQGVFHNKIPNARGFQQDKSASILYNLSGEHYT